MPRIFRLLAALCFAAPAPASAQPAHFMSTTLGGHQAFVDGKTTDTVTITFRSDSPMTYTVDFTVQYPGQRPSAAPAVVDVVIAEHVADDEHPAASMRVGDDVMDLTARPRSARTIVATIPFEQYVALVQADHVVQSAFGRELELAGGPLKMLRNLLPRWDVGR